MWCERREQIPVRGAHEGEPLPLAVHDEPRRGGLHASRREAGSDLAPQHGGNLIAVETVEDAAGLLRVDKRGVDVARVVAGVLDRFLGDLVEDHPLDGHLRFQDLEEVPGDGLPFAILISGEVELVGILEGAFEVGDGLALLVGDDVIRLEVILDID